MKVLIVHNILWAHYKAAVFQALDQLARRRGQTQVRVLQIARNEQSRAGWEETATDAPVYQYEYELLFDRFVEDVPVRDRTRALLSRMRTFAPDILYLTGYYDPAQLVLLAYAKLTGVPVVMQMESTAADNRRRGPKEVLKRAILRLCNGFFCFGSLQANYLTQLGVPPRKILLRKTAVDNQALLAAYDQAWSTRSQRQSTASMLPHNFVFVGRLIPPKNLPALVAAFAQALGQQPNSNWGLVFLGNGPLQTELEQQTATLNLSDRVRFFPATHWYRVPDTLALADVLVLPSRSEPWGLVVNEAMVCGMPVLVSDRCGCVADLVRNGHNGFTFDPDTPAQLAHRLAQFMQMPEAERMRMGESSKAIIRPWAPEAVAEEMLAGFHTLSNNQ